MFYVAAVLALSVAPVYSFSYLESLTGATPVTASSVDIAPPVPVAAADTEAPFFFTNGAQDSNADSPAFFFTSRSTHVPVETYSSSYLDDSSGDSATTQATSVPVETYSGSYLDDSGGDSSSGSYFDVIGNGVASVSGPGMANYLDALPHNSANGGPGLTSYASSLNQAASEVMASAPVSSAPEVVVVVAAAPVPAAVTHPILDLTSDVSIPTSSNYLDALATGASTGGAGIATYLDILPQTSTLSGGAGMSTYTSNLVSANVVSGAGVPSYADVLGGGIASFTNSFSPFGAASSSDSQSNFVIGSLTGRFTFTLKASDDIITQIRAAGDNLVTIRGKMMLN